jgi:hypothetical protein
LISIYTFIIKRPTCPRNRTFFTRPQLSGMWASFQEGLLRAALHHVFGTNSGVRTDLHLLTLPKN